MNQLSGQIGWRALGRSLLVLVVFLVCGERAVRRWFGEEGWKGLWYWRVVALLLVLVWIVFFAAGGTNSANAPGPGGRSTGGPGNGQQEALFDYAFDSLNRLEEFDSGEMLANILARLNPQTQQQRPLPNPLLQTWPEPEMLRQKTHLAHGRRFTRRMPQYQGLARRRADQAK